MPIETQELPESFLLIGLFRQNLESKRLGSPAGIEMGFDGNAAPGERGAEAFQGIRHQVGGNARHGMESDGVALAARKES